MEIEKSKDWRVRAHERFSFAPPFSERFFRELGWSPRARAKDKESHQKCNQILLLCRTGKGLKKAKNKEGESAINLINLGNFCQIWPRAIYLC